MKAYRLAMLSGGHTEVTHCRLAGDEQQPEQSQPIDSKAVHEYGAKAPQVEPAHGMLHAAGAGAGCPGEGGGGEGGGGLRSPSGVQQPVQSHEPPCRVVTSEHGECKKSKHVPGPHGFALQFR